MKSTRFLALLLCLCSTYSFSQKVNYNYLTFPQKMDNDSITINLIENQANKKFKTSPMAKDQILIWKFIVFDSLKLAEKRTDILDSINLNSKSLSRLTKAKILYYKGSNLAEETQTIESGIELLLKARDLAITENDKNLLLRIYYVTGKAYAGLSAYEKSIAVLNKGYNLAVSINDSALMLTCATTLANSYKNSKNFENAQKYYDIALDLAIKTKNDRMVAGNYNNIGSLEKQQGNNAEAIKYFLKAIEMNKKLENNLWLSFNYHNIGGAYANLGKHDLAIKYLLMSLKIKNDLGIPSNSIESYKNLSESYAKNGDYKNAYENLSRFNVLKDSFQIDEQKQALNEFEAKYESEKKELEIDRLEITGKYQKERNKTLEMKAQRSFNLALIFIFAGIILIGSVLLLVKRNRQRMNTNTILSDKNIEIQSTNLALQETLNELSVKNKEIIDSINYATYIQRASLPNIAQQSTDALKFELFFSPKDIVSGDFYFSYQMYNKSVFGVADCTGHGVPGAMVSLIGMNSIDKVVREEVHLDTGEMVSSLNKHVLENLQRGKEMINDGMDMSFCVFDHITHILKFSGAQHDAYILRKSNENNEIVEETDEVEMKIKNETHILYALKGARRPIGNWHGNINFFEVQFDVKQGDRIVLFSDGYADQIGGDSDKKMKKGKMLELILESGNLDSTRQMEMLKDEFISWQGNSEQVDDVCLLITEIVK